MGNVHSVVVLFKESSSICLMLVTYVVEYKLVFSEGGFVFPLAITRLLEVFLAFVAVYSISTFSVVFFSCS